MPRSIRLFVLEAESRSPTCCNQTSHLQAGGVNIVERHLHYDHTLKTPRTPPPIEFCSNGKFHSAYARLHRPIWPSAGTIPMKQARPCVACFIDSSRTCIPALEPYILLDVGRNSTGYPIRYFQSRWIMSDVHEGPH